MSGKLFECDLHYICSPPMSVIDSSGVIARTEVMYISTMKGTSDFMVSDRTL